MNALRGSRTLTPSAIDLIATVSAAESANNAGAATAATAVGAAALNPEAVVDGTTADADRSQIIAAADRELMRTHTTTLDGGGGKAIPTRRHSSTSTAGRALSSHSSGVRGGPEGDPKGGQEAWRGGVRIIDGTKALLHEAVADAAATAAAARMTEQAQQQDSLWQFREKVIWQDGATRLTA